MKRITNRDFVFWLKIDFPFTTKLVVVGKAIFQLSKKSETGKTYYQFLVYDVLSVEPHYAVAAALARDRKLHSWDHFG